MTSYLKITLALNFFELLACLVGFANWHKIKNSYWKFFPMYLALIFISEIGAEYLYHILRLNYVSNNIYFFFTMPLQFFFFFWLFSKWYHNLKERNWAYLGAAIYVVSWMAELLYLGESNLNLLSFSYTIGNIVLLVLILQFFIIFVKSDKILFYYHEPMFWVCLGLLIFYLMSLPFFGMWNTLRKQYPHFFDQYWKVQMIFDCCMYCLFCVAFTKGKWKQPFL
jgi:hypothetical protein